MTHAGQPGFSGLSILLAFAGGALIGGAAAALFTPVSGPEARRRVAGAVDQGRQRLSTLAGDTTEAAGRLPQALRDASSAATEAFTEAMRDGTA